MKNLLVSLILCCFAICGYAQEHLSFKGIPITGSLTSFSEKLKAKGFTQVHSTRNSRIFEGLFTGRQVTVGAAASDNGQDVFSVVVFFPPTDSWNVLVNTYQRYKNLYIEKYGNPTLCIEDNPSSSDSNTSLMHALSQGRVKYVSGFKTQGGNIEISLRKAITTQELTTIKAS